jgi:heat shock protein HslJ
MRIFGIGLLLVAAAAGAAEAQTGGRRGGGDGQKGTPGYERPPPRQDKVFPTKVSWTAVSLNGKAFSGERPTFILDEQFRMRGFGGCNTFAATAYPLRQQKFAVGPFALPTPRKSCEKAITDQENNFLIALRTSVEWDSVLGTLVVKTQNGELKFERSI